MSNRNKHYESKVPLDSNFTAENIEFQPQSTKDTPSIEGSTIKAIAGGLAYFEYSGFGLSVPSDKYRVGDKISFVCNGTIGKPNFRFQVRK